MYFIVDSGSTKSDWVLVNSGQKDAYFSTMGFNPYFHNEKTISEEMKRHGEIMEYANLVEEVFFYGAGCSSKRLNAIIEKGLKAVFTNAKIHVDHDLKACAFATYTGKPAISCIIGTGSNSCYFDGENVVEEVPALGYILGDEASGSYFGKQLLAAFLYKKLPKHIENDLRSEYGISKDSIVDHVYMKPNANVYLASFSKFISRHPNEPFFKEMVYEGMKKFMEIHVCCYQNYREVETHFVGSISSVFEAELKKAANELGVKVGKIIKKPIEGLVQYHLSRKALSN